MNRLLALALLVSVCLHTSVITFVPTGRGGTSNGAAHIVPLQASLRLPNVTGDVTLTGAPLAQKEARKQDDQPTSQSRDESAAHSEFGFPLPAAPHYFESAELTDKPAALDALPSDLEKVLPAGSSGDAVLVLEIDEKGIVTGISPERSNLDPTSLRKITDAFQGMRFLPGRIGKVPVKTRMRIEVRIDDLLDELSGTNR